MCVRVRACTMQSSWYPKSSTLKPDRAAACFRPTIFFHHLCLVVLSFRQGRIRRLPNILLFQCSFLPFKDFVSLKLPRCFFCTSRFDLLKPSGFFTYHQVEHSKILHGARFALSVLYGYQNRQRLFPYTSLTDRLLQPRWKEFIARYGLIPYIKQFTIRL